MCVAKTPKVTTAEQKVKDPIVIRNKYLDGTGPQIKALRTGRSSLRIERAGSGAAAAAPPALAPLPTRAGGSGAYVAPPSPFTDVRFGGGWGSSTGNFADMVRLV